MLLESLDMKHMTGPYFFLSNVHPPSPMPFVTRAWWTSSTEKGPIFGRPPEVGDQRWLEGCVPAALRAGEPLLSQCFGVARATSIPPRATVAPLFYIP